MEINKQDIISYIKTVLSKECNLPLEQITPDSSFFELGLDSISAVYLLSLVEKNFNILLSPIDFWDYPTIQTFSDYIFDKFFSK